MVSVLKNEERFCITGYSTLNQRMSERNLMLNCSCSRIFCVLCTFGDQHNKVMFCMHICSHDKTCSFIEGYSTVKQGSAAFEESCTEVFCQKILHVYKCRSSQRVLLPGHEISLIALLAMSFSCAGCSDYLEGFVWFSGSWIKQSSRMLFLGVSGLQSSPKIFMGLGFWCLCHELLNTCHIPTFVSMLNNLSHFPWCH